MRLPKREEDFGAFTKHRNPLMDIGGEEIFRVISIALIQVFFRWFLEKKKFSVRILIKQSQIG